VRAIGVSGGHLRPQSTGLAGLGLINSSYCDSFEQAIEYLGFVVKRGEAEKLTSANFVSAKKMHEAETSWNIFNRTPVTGYPFVSNCVDRTQAVVNLLVTVNAELKQPVPLPPNLVAKGQPPEPMPAWQKMAIIGGISVVGIVAVAYITGQVAPLLRVFKR